MIFSQVKFAGFFFVRAIGVPPSQKGHGTRGWEGALNQRLGYPPGGEQTGNITFPHTSYVGSKKMASKVGHIYFTFLDPLDNCLICYHCRGGSRTFLGRAPIPGGGGGRLPNILIIFYEKPMKLKNFGA